MSKGLADKLYESVWLEREKWDGNFTGEFLDAQLTSFLKNSGKIVFPQLLSGVEANCILPEFQSRFRSDFNCTAYLSHIADDISKASDKGLLKVLILHD